MGAGSENRHAGEVGEVDLKRELEKSEMERKRLESVLKDLESRLNTIIQNVTEIIYMLDSNGLITFINNGVERFGFSPRELIGVNIFELVHPHDRDRAHFHVNERRRGERSTRAYEVRFVTKEHASGIIDIGERAPLLTVTAEGQYQYTDSESLSFVGTIGVARTGDSAVGALSSGPPGIVSATGEQYMIPICASCKDIRNSDNEWERIESYLYRTCGMKFTHTICPDCTRKLYPDIDHSEE